MFKHIILSWPAALRLGLIAIQFAVAPMLFAMLDPSMILAPVSLSNNQFQFTLNAESGITYFIQASTNLSDWVSVATNADPGTTRVITMTNLPDGQGFYRAARRPSGFALLAVGKISLAGGVVVDSFDSSLGPYSSTNRQAGGNIGTDSIATNAISLGGAHICGKANTGPGGLVYIAGGGAVGDLDWNATNTGIEAGWANDTMNLAFPSNSPPPGPFLAPSVITTGGSNITYLSNGLYQVYSFVSSDSAHPMIVTGNATLFVTGNFTVEGSGYVQILPGASLAVYVAGTTFTISGTGIINSTGLASNCSLIGLLGCTSFIYSGSSALVGTVNTPEATVTFSGATGDYGVIIANSINFSGASSMHYDESLGITGPSF